MPLGVRLVPLQAAENIPFEPDVANTTEGKRTVKG